jgi:hypothetical protein
MVGEKSLGVNPLVDRSNNIWPGRKVWERNRQCKTIDLPRCKTSSVKLQEILLSWKCPSAFLVWEFMGGN